jgi:hypothetical protein
MTLSFHINEPLNKVISLKLSCRPLKRKKIASLNQQQALEKHYAYYHHV